MARRRSPATRDPVRCFRSTGKEFLSGEGIRADRAVNACTQPGPTSRLLWLEGFREDCSVSKRRPRGLIRCDAAAKGIRMPSVRKRLETLERSQSVRGGTSKDQIVRRVLEGVSDAELDLLGSAADALAQGRELTPAECAAAEAYASAVARESGSVRSPVTQGKISSCCVLTFCPSLGAHAWRLV